jgi:dienelactone hydrolase
MAESIQIEVSPTRALLDEPVAMRVTGAQSRQHVTLRARVVGHDGTAWESEATFVADDAGTIDLGRAAPVAGSYAGVDPMGLFWSMRRQDDLANPALFQRTDPLTYHLSAEIDGRGVATAEVERLVMADGVTVEEVRERGLVARLFRPPGGPRPCIVVWGGSDGGYTGSSLLSALLASHGFATLALAYFGIDPLPARCVNIPLEYFATAFDWLAARSDVDGTTLGVMGRSRGGELTLLLAATFSRIRAAVAHVPSHVVWGGIADQSNPVPPSAWTLGGEPLPALSRGRAAAEMQTAVEKEPIRLTPLFLEALADLASAERAAIPVERIRCPLLLISGKEDAMWPSALMAERVVERLAARGHSYPVAHLSYDGVGHSVGLPPSLPTTAINAFHPVARDVFALGGNPADIARANADSWQRVRAFFREHLIGGNLGS